MNSRRLKERRSKTLIKKNFQKSFLKLIILSMSLLTVIIMGLFYALLKLKVQSAGFSGYTEERLSELIVWLYWAVPLLALFLILIAVVWGIHIFSKIAGPLYALEKQLKGLLEDQNDRVQLRKEDDELIPLANLINRLIDKKDKDIEAAGKNA